MAQVQIRPAGLVSIHAPAKGATNVQRMLLGQPKVSIHAPAKGATRKPVDRTPGKEGFNPRPREGGDAGTPVLMADGDWFQSTPPRRGRPLIPDCCTQGTAVSIHAPAKGAT